MTEKKILLKKYAGFCMIFVFLAALFYLAPTTHDDWYYERGNTFSNLFSVSLSKWYHGLNGRVLGNSLVSMTGGNRPLRALVQALIVFGIWKLATQVIKASKCTSLLFLAAVVLIPVNIYAQTYGWASGFFNYVPEVCLTLGILSLIIHSQKLPPNHALLQCIPAALLSFCTQLFSENVTIINMFLGACLIVAGIVLHRKAFAILPACGIGFLLGGAVMFLSPAYGKSAYYDSSDSASLLDKILENYQTVSLFTLRLYWISTLILTVSLVVLIVRSQKGSKKTGTILSTFLVLCQCYFILYHMMLQDTVLFYNEMMVHSIDFIVNIIYVLCVLFAVIRLVDDMQVKLLAAGLLILAIAYAAPLLVVSPIGPRCFYNTYIYILMSAFAVGEYTFGSLLSETGTAKLVCSIICICAACTCLFINLKNYVLFSERIETISRGMQAGNHTIELRSYPYPQYIWGANSQTIGVFYFYEQQNDILFTYTDY
ncbi:MAG: DUF6056 family protein [Clostridia bacterium]|nr:DUF6056 family protein [Clostridia bacterium]